MGKWIETKERFVNPYNFVPFEKAMRGPISAPKSENMTGVITCEMTVLTPLFIPNTSNSHALHKGEDGESYDFFSYQDLSGKNCGEILANPCEPVIPGSEIRGAVRSVFEAAFHGCASQVDLERVMERRSMKPKCAGILKKENGEWRILKCERLMLNVREIGEYERYNFGKRIEKSQYVNWEEGKKLYVRKSKTPYKKGIFPNVYVVDKCEEEDSTSEKLLIGYLHKGEGFPRKHHESVFVPYKKDESSYECVKVDEKSVEYLKKMIYSYKHKNDDNKNKPKEQQVLYPKYEIHEDKETLVYYLLNEKNEACYLSPACIGKEMFQQSFKKLLKNHGVLPCETRKKICPACELFGMVAREKNEDGALGSRVRFGDAELTKKSETGYEEYYCPELVLPEMGEPKPGAVEFYTLPPEKKLESGYNYWTYDYKVAGHRRIFFKDDNQEKIQLRGRKFYWHSNAWKQIQKEQLSKMRQKIRPLKITEKDPTEKEPKIKFSFNVYFENVTLLELQRLCWALDFNDKDCAHKIGRGKPLGFGSVRIENLNVYLRKISEKTGKWSNEEDLAKEEWKDKFEVPHTESIVGLKQILKWNEDIINKVCYPKGEGLLKPKNPTDPNRTASHQWFNGNRDRRIGKECFCKVLPKIEEEIGTEEKWLYKLEEDNKK